MRLLLFGMIAGLSFTTSAIARETPKYDSFGRLIDFPGKLAVACPKQRRSTAVLLVAGQSNSANHGEARFKTGFSKHVLNYFDGKCYIAASPLLGATGASGEFITPLADKLVTDGTFKTVVIVASGITATPISRWEGGGDLNQMLLRTVRQLSAASYQVTAFIWHQGETDFQQGTSTEDYEKAFASLLSSLTDIGVRAPAFIAIASRCGATQTWWQAINRIATAQRALIDNGRTLLGADTDALGGDDRQLDGCHLSESGQIKTAASYANAIEAYFARAGSRGGANPY